MTLAIGVALLTNILEFSNRSIQKYSKVIGWTLVAIGIPEYILSVVNLIGRF